MSYDTCENCDRGIEKPTEDEILENDWHCKNCGTRLEVYEELLREVLQDMLTRIRVLEGRE